MALNRIKGDTRDSSSKYIPAEKDEYNFFQNITMRSELNKTKRFFRLDNLLRDSEGHTLNEFYQDPELDNISKRSLLENLKELKDKYGAEYEPNLFRGRERLWRYKDITFSIAKKTADDIEIIRKSIDNLSLFKGDPRYDMLRFYLIGLERGISDTGLNFMSFDNNNEATGLDYIESILDAITHQYPLRLKYKPFDKEEFEIYFHPYHLRQYNRRWFIFGYVEDRKEIQNFPLDRIAEINHLSKPYIKTDVDFDEYFDEIVGVSNYKKSQIETIVLKIAQKSIDYIRTKPIHWSQTELKELSTDDYSFIQLKVKVNTELKMLLFSYSDAIEVIKPLWLRNWFAKRINDMMVKYKV